MDIPRLEKPLCMYILALHDIFLYCNYVLNLLFYLLFRYLLCTI